MQNNQTVTLDRDELLARFMSMENEPKVKVRVGSGPDGMIIHSVEPIE